MRKLMWFAIGFGCACGLGAYFLGAWLLWLAVAAGFSCAACLICCCRFRSFRIPAAILLGLFTGICWLHFYDHAILSNPSKLHGQTVTASMTALDQSEKSQYGCAAIMELIVDGKSYKVWTYFDDDLKLWPGDTVSCEIRLDAAGDTLKAKGIFLTAKQRSEPTVISALYMPLRHYPTIWRIRILERIDRLFPGDTAGFAKALILGERNDLSFETENAFRISGISHIIAVSGLHVSILVAMLYFLTGRNRFLSALIGLPMMLLFAAMVGFTPSITRACIMQCMMLIALLTVREYDGPTALAFAGLCILIGDPFAILSVSFQLSFGCLIGIFLFSDKIYSYLMGKLGKSRKLVGALKKWFSASVSITLGAGVITTPLVAYYFGAVSLVSVLTNLLTLWAVSIIFYGIQLALLLSLISLLAGSAAAWVISFLIRFVPGTAKLLASFPLAAVYTESPYVVAWLVACYLLLLVFLLWKKRSLVRFCLLLTGMLALALTLSWAEPRMDECRVTVLDVGQGQAVILQSEGETYLVDCGSENPESAAEKTMDHLLSQGIFRLDGIIVTHYDTDHVGGVPYLLTKIPADAVYLPKAGCHEEAAMAVIAAAENVFWVENDVSWTFGQASIQLFAPETLELGNESSVCILFRTEKCDILITGDRSRDGELRLVQRVELPELELLIAGHHGSKSATSDSLLLLTSPEYVFISAGENNRYGHPNGDVLDRLHANGCAIFRTDLHGDLIFRR